MSQDDDEQTRLLRGILQTEIIKTKLEIDRQRAWAPLQLTCLIILAPIVLLFVAAFIWWLLVVFGVLK